MSSHLPPPGGAVRIGRDPAVGSAPARASVAIGFGSPADDSGVTRLDLNDILVKHPQATFLMRAAGDAMREAGIDAGDVLIVDRAVTPAHGHVVVAVVEDEFVCRRLVMQGGKQGDTVRLRAAAPGHADLVADEGQDLAVWGVVTHAIKPMPV